MALTIIKLGDMPPSLDQLDGPDIDPEQVEIFGRLRLSRDYIAKWYGITTSQVEKIFKRTEIRAAYDRGRAQIVVALRQKQLELALGNESKKIAPDVRLLLHAGEHFADQQRGAVQEEVDDYQPGRFSWDVEMKKRLENARSAFLAGAEPADDA